MKSISTAKAHPRQQGAALVVALIMLLVMTVLGIAAMQVTRIEERMAGNSRDVNLAFQGAEAGLRDAEARIAARPRDRGRIPVIGPCARSGAATSCRRSARSDTWAGWQHQRPMTTPSRGTNECQRTRRAIPSCHRAGLRSRRFLIPGSRSAQGAVRAPSTRSPVSPAAPPTCATQRVLRPPTRDVSEEYEIMLTRPQRRARLGVTT